MDISNLTKSELLKTVKGLSTQADKDEFASALFQYIKIQQKGRAIPDQIYSFLNNFDYVAFFAENGYAICLVSGEIDKKESMLPVYRNYSNYEVKSFSFVSKQNYEKRLASGEIFVDDFLGVAFFERSFSVYDEEFNQRLISSSHASHLQENGKLFLTQAARRHKVFTNFQTNFYPYGNAPKDWVIPEGDTSGIEIEMLFDTLENKLRFSTWVGRNFPGWVCEYDGSLEDHGNAGNCGLELISPPLIFDDISSQSKAICEKALEFGGKGFKAGTIAGGQAGIYYGMHVTTQVPKSSRGGPSRATIASRYIAFLNAPTLRQFWQLVARRKGDSFNTYSPFQNVNLETCLQTERGDGGNRAHRRAVFVRNPNLLETRIFRANLSPIQVKANIEICHLTMQYCASSNFSLTEFRPYWDYLQKNMSSELRRCLYRKLNPPIKELNQAMIESELQNSPDDAELYQ